MFVLDSSLTGTPSNSQKLHETTPRHFTDEPSEEYYSKNLTLSMLRSNPKLDGKWGEIQSSNAIHYDRPQPISQNEPAMMPKANQPYFHPNDPARAHGAMNYPYRPVINHTNNYLPPRGI